VRVEEARERHITTKSGKPGTVATTTAWVSAFASSLTDAGDLPPPTSYRPRAWSGRPTSPSKLRVPEDIGQETRRGAGAGAAYEAVWESPCQIDPFSVSCRGEPALLTSVDQALLAVEGHNTHRIVLRVYAQAAVLRVIHRQPNRPDANHYRRWLHGYSFKGDEIQKRSYPNSFGGQYQLKGYELVHELDLLGNAPRYAEEAVALHSADACPEGEFNLVLDSSQLGLQIHESIGHPIELDRVLGSEANYAGMSFLTLDKLNI
jgi:predicted Zn-dependent protease